MCYISIKQKQKTTFTYRSNTGKITVLLLLGFFLSKPRSYTRRDTHPVDQSRWVDVLLNNRSGGGGRDQRGQKERQGSAVHFIIWGPRLKRRLFLSAPWQPSRAGWLTRTMLVKQQADAWQSYFANPESLSLSIRQPRGIFMRKRYYSKLVIEMYCLLPHESVSTSFVTSQRDGYSPRFLTNGVGRSKEWNFFVFFSFPGSSLTE